MEVAEQHCCRDLFRDRCRCPSLRNFPRSLNRVRFLNLKLKEVERLRLMLPEQEPDLVRWPSYPPRLSQRSCRAMVEAERRWL
jgi:hypothetical protein